MLDKLLKTINAAWSLSYTDNNACQKAPVKLSLYEWKVKKNMRLWHEKLIPILPDAQLLGQHRECAALRGNGWGKKHSTVDYIYLTPLIGAVLVP